MVPDEVASENLNNSVASPDPVTVTGTLSLKLTANLQAEMFR